MWIMNSKFTHFLSLNLIQPLYNVVLPPSLTHFPGIGSGLAAVIGFAIVEYCIPDYRLGKTDGDCDEDDSLHGYSCLFVSKYLTMGLYDSNTVAMKYAAASLPKSVRSILHSSLRLMGFSGEKK